MRLVNIDDERFWNILFDEACVEGQQAERIQKELEKIIAYDVEKVVEELDSLEDVGRSWTHKSISLIKAKEVVRKGGVNE